MTKSSELVIGVDGGGTKTAAWLAPLEEGGSGAILGRGQAGPGNPRAAGFDVAQANIAAAIAAAFADARIPRQTVAAACFGLAGAGRAAEQEHIKSWAISRGIAQQVQVTGDAEPILAAAAPDNVGVVLICGTGSLAWGRNAAGETARCGGWGYLLGDEGSAYAIAQTALRRAVQSVDRRAGPSLLFMRLQQAVGATTVEQFVDRVYAPEMTRERLASLAQVVFEVAATDREAGHIIRVAGCELATLVYSLAGRLGFEENGYPLALAGSVILQQDSLRATVLERVNSILPPRSVTAVTEPVVGAVTLARALLA